MNIKPGKGEAINPLFILLICRAGVVRKNSDRGALLICR